MSTTNERRWRVSMRLAARVARQVADGSLSNQQRKALTRWMNRSEHNRQAFDCMQRRITQLDGLSRQSRRRLSTHFATLKGTPIPRVAVRHRSLQRIVAVAASICVIGFGVAYVEGWWGEQSYATAHAENCIVPLADGSTVQLGAISKVAVEYGAQERKLTMKGSSEAYFVVAKDTTRPFIVWTGSTSVRATGTAFNVARDDDWLEVAVERGSVEVTQGAKQLALDAGKKVVIRPSTGTAEVDSIEVRAVGSWRNHQMRFDRETLGVVLRRVSRYATSPLIIADEGVKDQLFTGVIDLNRVDQWALTVLPENRPLKARQLSNGTIEIASE